MSKKLTEIVLATKNAHKVQELNDMLMPLGIRVLATTELNKDISWVEDGKTFEENSLIKAKAIREFWSGAILADDSGLCVDALDGAPGIYSSRFAGEDASDEDNNKKLLTVLENEKNRTANFVCCLCFLDEKNNIEYFNGRLEGMIAEDYAGKGGFGYDPIFVVKEGNKHLALYSAEEKNKISHRSNALQLLIKYLKDSEQV
jgi:XTP/dITP diphosphohydrolase